MSAEDVRLVGGELFGDFALFLQTMLEAMAIQVAAWSPWKRPPAVAGSAPLYGTSPCYVFVVGPVQSVHDLPPYQNVQSFLRHSATRTIVGIFGAVHMTYGGLFWRQANLTIDQNLGLCQRLSICLNGQAIQKRNACSSASFSSIFWQALKDGSCGSCHRAARLI